MLWGIITAPTIPTACSSCTGPQPLQYGTNMPFRTSAWFGATRTYCKDTHTQTLQRRVYLTEPVYRQQALLNLVAEADSHDGDEEPKESLQLPQTWPKQTRYANQTEIRVALFTLTLFSADLPYLSRNRNTNVSMMVISTPAHRGILQKNKHKLPQDQL